MYEISSQKIIDQIVIETKRVQTKACVIAKQEQSDESVVLDFAKDFSDTYFMLLDVIDKRFETVKEFSFAQAAKNPNENDWRPIDSEKTKAYFALGN